MGSRDSIKLPRIRSGSEQRRKTGADLQGGILIMTRMTILNYAKWCFSAELAIPIIAKCTCQHVSYFTGVIADDLRRLSSWYASL